MPQLTVEVPRAGQHNGLNFTNQQTYVAFLCSAIQGVAANPSTTLDQVVGDAFDIADEASFFFHYRMQPQNATSLPGPDDVTVTDSFEDAYASYRLKCKMYEEALIAGRESVKAERERQAVVAAVEAPDSNVEPLAPGDRKIAELRAAIKTSDAERAERVKELMALLQPGNPKLPDGPTA